MMNFFPRVEFCESVLHEFPRKIFVRSPLPWALEIPKFVASTKMRTTQRKIEDLAEKHEHFWLVVEPYPSEKWWSESQESVGIIVPKCSQYMEEIKMFQTTNQF